MMVPRGDGFGCVGGPLFRVPGLVRIGASFGLAAKHIDFDRPPASAGAGAITTGSTWNFQFWYRDPASPSADFNLTNGVEVTFEP